MPKRTSSFRDDLLADLADPQEAAHYLNAALEDSEEMFLVALRDVAEAKQMAKVAEIAGVARESVYRMLTVRGNPTYTNLVGILRAVGLKIAIAADAATDSPIQPIRTPGENTQANMISGIGEAANGSSEESRLAGSAWTPRKDMRTAITGAGILSQSYSAASAT